jgi:LuxR family transcriptional regulator, maltose regulon positive regulatory protein
MGRTATIRQSRPVLRRRIIERRRLLSLLDDAKARVRMLVAPAGYGKTTLAEQWVESEGRHGAWYTARRSSRDVAAIALGIARASCVLVPECDARLREHLRAVPTPAENVDVLAEILGEDLEAWPSDGWLVLDEYQEIGGARESERFVAGLVAASPVQVLVATRQRPSWVTTRELLYGEVFELNQASLAMDSAEAAEVLGSEAAQSASGLVALANGWPAVIGLASVSTAELTGDEALVPETLYRFFAEEVFGSLGNEAQDGLSVLSQAPVLDRDLAGLLLGDDADDICQAALDVGVLVERGATLELHPLARSFLAERSANLVRIDERVVSRCLGHYRARRDWDAGFELVARHRVAAELEGLLLAALDELLDTARLSTIETWCALAAELELETPAFALARAEVALRRGRHAVAQAQAEAAASSKEPSLTFRAFSVAGRAAHLASREEEALELYRRAEATAASETERRDALWGQVMCSIELERPEAVAALEELATEGALTIPREIVRAAGHRLYSQFRLGSLDLEEADLAYELLPSVRDPLVASSFQAAYSAALAASSRYSEALGVANELLDCAREYRYEFAVPYAKGVAAICHAGMRQWQEAERNLLEGVAASTHDSHAEQFCYSVHLRVLAQQARHQAALALPSPPMKAPQPAARAELLCSRALVLACIGRVDEAQAIVIDTSGSTRAVEPIVLMAAVDAICSLKRREPEAGERVAALEDTAFETGAVDLLVTAYRASPELLAVLLSGSPPRDRLIALIRRVADDDLARAIGYPISDVDPRSRLTPREREVFQLLRQGLTNRQIAKLLFIEESTVKVHTHHIYDKLGTRSRTALAVQAALERADQATSAMGTADSAEES